MNATEIVIHEIKGKRVLMILDLFRESIRQPREAAHRHTHREVLAFDVACRNVAAIGPSCDCRGHRANALSGTVASLRFGIVPIELDQHRVVNVGAKCILDRLQIYAVAICGQLNAISKTAGQIVHKSLGGLRSPRAESERGNQFSIGINRNPRPNVSISELAAQLFRDILFLRVAELPNLVALNSLAGQVAERLVLIFRARLTNSCQQLKNGILSNPSHADGCANRITLNKGRNHLRLAFNWEVVHV